MGYSTRREEPFSIRTRRGCALFHRVNRPGETAGESPHGGRGTASPRGPRPRGGSARAGRGGRRARAFRRWRRRPTARPLRPRAALTGGVPNVSPRNTGAHEARGNGRGGERQHPGLRAGLGAHRRHTIVLYPQLQTGGCAWRTRRAPCWASQAPAWLAARAREGHVRSERRPKNFHRHRRVTRGAPPRATPPRDGRVRNQGKKFMPRLSSGRVPCPVPVPSSAP